ncbi:cyclic-di-AMP-binding protein CbpB [Priestia aryabhattai]|uniref:cyclic-di-AMP-binding protein CbpB n=1 Tax=Priestia aryabhattai TaxID=412384 RepID=UPI001CFA2C6E|nr:cyclic-di-AMP-binding protein CbpB [Priestia aryabhattai]
MIDIDHNQLNQIELRDLLVTSDKVAHVQVGNNLEHALLVLTKTGYTSIPVLNPRFQLQGFVSMTLILDSILGLKRIEFERLETMKVEEVMNQNVPRVSMKKSVLKVINAMINHHFLCVENEDGIFEGILTRRNLLKSLRRQSIILPKESFQ